MFICGDLNSIIGQRSETSVELDGLPSRKSLDKTLNQHGHALIEFLKESKMCILNGRADPQNDNYTFIQSRGKSVVDNICVPQDVLVKCESFNVLQTGSLVDTFSLHHLLGASSKLPDHCFILTQFRAITACTGVEKYVHNNVYSKTNIFKLGRIPKDMFQSDVSRHALGNIVENIETYRDTQLELDQVYDDLCGVILMEMEEKLPKYKQPDKPQKRHIHSKPYWNEELSHLWKAMRNKENLYCKCSQTDVKRQTLRNEFHTARNTFDLLLRKMERQQRRKQANGIEMLNTKNPNEFWRKIKQLPKDIKDMFQSDVSRHALGNIVENIETYRDTQLELDQVYDDLCGVILMEMEEKLPKYKQPDKPQKRHIHSKPYWNEELSHLWKAMRNKENLYCKCSQTDVKRQTLRNEFHTARNTFDLLLRKMERQQRRKQANDIEMLNTKNPNEFWRKIKQLGPQKSRQIPMEIITDDDCIIFKHYTTPKTVFSSINLILI
ncbi:hypothetical protein SNE40_018377 [Patella caerulea]|uniref:Uncharacterized protein n=1 Tax=Patella caerulea TaxID=87958 RepID=A0AAN8PAR9_PATCE